MWTGLSSSPSNTWKPHSSAKVPSVSPIQYLSFLSLVQTTLFSLLDSCNGLLPLSSLVSTGLLTVQWFSCLKLFWGLPWYPVQSGLLTQGPYHHSLLMAHVHPQSSIPQLATLTFLHFSLCPSLSCLRAYATTIPTAWNTLSLPMALCYLSIKSKLQRGFSWPSEPRKSLTVFSSFPSWHSPYFKVGV